MISLPPEIERVEKDLIDREITGSEASDIISKVRRKLGPPWHWCPAPKLCTIFQ